MEKYEEKKWFLGHLNDLCIECIFDDVHINP